jgi:hypothetical protein
MPHRHFLRATLACAALALTAACAESPSAGNGSPAPAAPGSPAQLRLTCSADVAHGTVRCAQPSLAGGLRADRIMGQGSGMSAVSGNIAIVADTFAFDLGVSNGLSVPVGTSNGVSADSNGIRVFVVDGIHTTQGTGSVTVANADGLGTFTASSQPYFAYPGILQPDSATAPHRWKFRFDPGVKTFSFGLYLSVPVPPGGGGVWMKVLAPATDTVVGDSFLVRVQVDSASAPISSVHASAAGRRVRLVRSAGDGANQLSGTLSMAGLPKQAVQLAVDAGTIGGDTARVTLPITKDAPPRVIVTAPGGNFWVAAPYLRIDADCMDDDPAGCSEMSAFVHREFDHENPGLSVTGTTSIHASMDLSTPYVEGMLYLFISGSDSRGAWDGYSSRIYVVSASSIVRVDSGGSLAMDADSTRLLFADAYRNVWINQRPGGTRTLIRADSTFDYEPYGWLYPLGALFSLYENMDVYDWRAGVLTDLGSSYLDVAGNWAIHGNGFGRIVRRDLATGTEVTVTSSGIPGDVADNGDVVWSNGNVYRYRDGVATQLTSDGGTGRFNVYPVTDGVNVAYLKTDNAATTYPPVGRVTLWHDGVETTLSTVSYSYFPEHHFAVNGGWTAYVDRDNAGFRQVRTRAPDGTDRLAANNAAFMYALGPDGTVVYADDSGMWASRAPYTGPRTQLGVGWLRPVFHGSRLLLYLGNSVFEATY